MRPRALVGLYLPNPLTDPVALGLGDGAAIVRNSFDRPLLEMSPSKSSK